MKTKEGRRDDVVSILLAGVDGLRKAGCHLYVVGSAHADDNTIWVSEVWESTDHHDASLQLPWQRPPSARRCRCSLESPPAKNSRVEGGVGV